MDYVQLTLLCCRHAIVLVRHGWTLLADGEAAGGWRGALGRRSQLRVDG